MRGVKVVFLESYSWRHDLWGPVERNSQNKLFVSPSFGRQLADLGVPSKKLTDDQDRVVKIEILCPRHDPRLVGFVEANKKALNNDVVDHSGQPETKQFSVKEIKGSRYVITSESVDTEFGGARENVDEPDDFCWVDVV